MPIRCPLCTQNPRGSTQTNNPKGYSIECECCGDYWIEWSLIDSLQDEYAAKAWKVAAHVREKRSMNLAVVLFPKHDQIPPGAPNGAVGIEEAIESFPKSVAERLDRILLNLERMTPHLGAGILIEQGFRPLLMVKNTAEATFVMTALTELGYVAGYHSVMPCNVQLTAKGLAHVAALQRGLFGPLSKQAFVAMSFDTSLTTAWKDGLKPGIDECGYTAMRVDAKEHNDKICDVIIAEIRKSKFLVADFTLHRGGVYFEAGLMMGLGRPVIFTCRNDELSKAHFDTRQYNHIGWDAPADLREKVKRRIQATIVP